MEPPPPASYGPPHIEPLSPPPAGQKISQLMPVNAQERVSSDATATHAPISPVIWQSSPQHSRPSENGSRKHPLEDHPWKDQSLEYPPRDMGSRWRRVGHLGGDGFSAKVGDSESKAQWSRCAHVVREYDSQLIRSWKTDMDTTLVFVSVKASFHIIIFLRQLEAD